MLKNRITRAAFKPALLIAVLCIVIGLGSSAMASGSHALTALSESLLIGGSDCADFMDGFAIGMGIGALLGCVWCAGGAIIAKGIGIFC